MGKIRKLVSFDWAMKRLLRSKANFDILEGFLSELLNDDIKILAILESESNKDIASDKVNRLDLKVANRKNEIIIIEIQYEREYDYFYRMLFAAAKTVSEHLDEGTAYSKVVKVISVNILYFDLGHGKDYIYHGQTKFTGLHQHDELSLSLQQQKLFGPAKPQDIFPEYYLIKVNNFGDVARNTLDEWIYFLKNETVKAGFKAKGLQQAKKRLDILKLSKEERAAYNCYADDLHYQASMVESSYGLGVIEGREEGEKKGKIAGKIEGIIEGEKKAKIATALNMLGKGLSVAEVSDYTGISMSELEALISQHATNKVSESVAPYSARKKNIPRRRTAKYSADRF